MTTLYDTSTEVDAAEAERLLRRPAKQVVDGKPHHAACIPKETGRGLSFRASAVESCAPSSDLAALALIVGSPFLVWGAAILLSGGGPLSARTKEVMPNV